MAGMHAMIEVMEALATSWAVMPAQAGIQYTRA
jgi:hypothetical protein